MHPIVEQIWNIFCMTFICHTGMHIIPITYRICTIVNCSPGQLLAAVYSTRFEKQIGELIVAIELMQKNGETHKRQMWRYGRIFTSWFMAKLQTKTCPKFVYLFACMLKKENAKSAENILQIKQLEEVSPEDQERCKIGAEQALKLIYLIMDEGQSQSLVSQVFSV